MRRAGPFIPTGRPEPNAAQQQDTTQKLAQLLKALAASRLMRDDSMPCEILPGLYLGSYGAARDKEQLNKLGITHVLSVASSLPPPFPGSFEYLVVDILDSPEADLKQHFETCFRFLDKCRLQGGNALVHCFAGRSRSVTIVVAWLMKTTHRTLKQALSYVQERRSVAQPNPGFMAQLALFESSGSGRPRGSTAAALAAATVPISLGGSVKAAGPGSLARTMSGPTGAAGALGGATGAAGALGGARSTAGV